MALVSPFVMERQLEIPEGKEAGDTRVEPGSASAILSPGRNCWRLAHASRVAFLIDGAAYFEAFATAVERARRSVLIVGWDIDSRMRLRPQRQDSRRPDDLVSFLNAVVAHRRGLHVHMLGWDFSMIYAFKRESLPIVKHGRRTHHRIHFRLDGNHPVGGSHHQKIVVVDDAVAFVGGLDLANVRWDTPEHLPRHPARLDPDGAPYGPFHDIQVMVDGEAAAALGELVRERWWRGTGRHVRPPGPSASDPWPPQVSPDVEDTPVGIARTLPPYNGHGEVREVERLYLDSIAAARRHIYIENQYFTSAVVGGMLSARLQERDGPEVVLVLPQRTSGWLEETTMGVLRSRLLERLRASDRYGRLRAYYPVVPDLGENWINVHSKVFIVDDALARVGSSNLNNRSMGLDTECDLAIDAAGDARIARSVERFRDRLLGEHLGQPPQAVTERLRETGSLVAAVESLRGGKRTLTDLNGEVPEWLDELVPDTAIVDPERPIEPDKLIQQFFSDDVRRSVKHPIIRAVVIMTVIMGLIAAWHWTPLQEWLKVETIAAWQHALRDSPAGPFAVVGAFLLGSLLLIPVTLLIVGTAIAFGPISGAVYSLIGSLLSAATAYGLGKVLGRDMLRQLAGPRLDRLSRRIGRKGLAAVITARVVPLAPFTVINLVAGASYIRFRDFFLGTVIGMTPGIFLLTLFENRLESALQEPGVLNVAILVGLVLLFLFAVALLRRWLRADDGPLAGVIQREAGQRDASREAGQEAGDAA